MFPQRITIFGRPGSGKTTFAIRLGKLLHLPVYHLDKYFYTAKWAKRPNAEFMADQNALVANDAWIIDGNCTKSLETRFARTDIAIYFNWPRPICYWRVVKRRFSKDRTVDDRAIGCRETIRWSLLTYMWDFEDRIERVVPPLHAQYPKVRYYSVTNDEEAELLIQQLTKEKHSGNHNN